MGSWRLAAPALDPGQTRHRRSLRRRQQDDAYRPMEDGGQPAPHVVRAGGSGGAHRRMAARAGQRRALDRVHPLDAGVAGLASDACRHRAAAGKVTMPSHLRALGKDLGLAAAQSLLLTTFLAHQACSMADAIGRTLYRLGVSRRRLLQWVTAEQSQATSRVDLWSIFLRMSGSVAVGAAAVVVIGAYAVGAMWIALPLAMLWIASPWVAFRHQSLDDRARSTHAGGVGYARIQGDRATHLAVLRRLRHGGRQLASAGQLPGNPRSGRRASNLAHEHGSLSAVRRLRSGFRLGRVGRGRAETRGDARDHGSPAMLSRALLQLVRHAGSASPRAALCVVGGQRQPCGASGHGGRRVPRVAGAGGALRELLEGPIDAIDLALEALEALPEDVRTHALVRWQLQEALAELRHRCSDPSAAEDAVARLAALAQGAANLTDLAIAPVG